eukprot:4361014-Karenia_brevis.AAC.1
MEQHLGFELEIRHEACQKIREDNVTSVSAINTDCKDTYLRDVYLVAPTTWSSSVQQSGGSKRARSPDNDSGGAKEDKGKSEKKGNKLHPTGKGSQIMSWIHSA